MSRVPEPGGVGHCALLAFGDGFGYRIVILALCLILYKLSVTIQVRCELLKVACFICERTDTCCKRNDVQQGVVPGYHGRES